MSELTQRWQQHSSTKTSRVHFGAPKAGNGQWASVIRVMNPIQGNIGSCQLEQMTKHQMGPDHAERLKTGMGILWAVPNA